MSGIPFWARKGAKVVCVRASSGDDTWAPLRERGIYTIREAYLDPGTGLPGVRLEEVVLGISDIYNAEYGYKIDRFRPLVDDANDNEIETVLYRKRKDKLHQRVSTKSRERA